MTTGQATRRSNRALMTTQPRQLSQCSFPVIESAASYWHRKSPVESALLASKVANGFRSATLDSSFVPVSFDHLVGAGEHGRRQVEPKRLRGFEVDHQVELGRRLHWQVGRLLALEDAIDIAGSGPVAIQRIRAVGD